MDKINRLIQYHCPITKKVYSADYFQQDKFCNCCNSARRLLAVEERPEEDYWTNFAAFAD